MKKKKILALIPARLKSKRLPGKIILPIEKIPLVIHVYKRVLMSKMIDDAIICCDDMKIYDVAKKFNAKVIKTLKTHVNGTERICEAYKKIGKKYDYIIDVQGDEPLINPNHIDQVVSFHLRNKTSDIIVPTLKVKNYINKNIVKIVSTVNNEVLYMSRAQIPCSLGKKEKFINKHLSIISFKSKAILDYGKSKRTRLEKIENIELLRALELGMKVKTFNLKGNSFSVDILSDYLKAKKYMKKDKIYKKYI